jgi:GT2 family glycosyltransferase
MPRVAVNIVTWNSMKFLPEALESIFGQSWSDFVVLIIDNGSTDGTTEYVRQNYPQAGILRNTRNLGFCRAHNQGLAHARAHLKPSGGDPLVLVTNPDVILEPDFLRNLVSEIDRWPSAGSAGGRILKAREENEDGLRQVIKTDRIDTVGVLPFRSCRFADRGSGQTDRNDRYRQPEEIFGVSGCTALYRLKALTDAAYKDSTVFDEDFFAYKEDVDLAWRLRLLGWKSVYAPDAVAYHFRTAAGGERPSPWQVIKGRRGRSKMVNQLSARNHRLMLFKNLSVRNWLIQLPFIFGYGLQKGLYSLLFEPRTFWVRLSAWGKLPRMWGKRRQTFRRAKATSKEIRRWFR